MCDVKDSPKRAVVDIFVAGLSDSGGVVAIGLAISYHTLVDVLVTVEEGLKKGLNTYHGL